jgi:hypothetical protein
MPGRDDKIYEEAAALWRQLHGESPPPEADGSDILCLIVGGLPDADYDRMATPHLRRTQIIFPKY